MQISFMSATEYLPRFQMGMVQPDNDDILSMLQQLVDVENDTDCLPEKIEDLESEKEELENKLEEAQEIIRKLMQPEPVKVIECRPEPEPLNIVDLDYIIEANKNIMMCFA